MGGCADVGHESTGREAQQGDVTASCHLLSAASAWLVSSIRCKKAAVRVLLQILLSILLILILFVITLLLTNVNTIRFANALLSLMTLLTA